MTERPKRGKVPSASLDQKASRKQNIAAFCPQAGTSEQQNGAASPKYMQLDTAASHPEQSQLLMTKMSSFGHLQGIKHPAGKYNHRVQ